MDDVRGDFISRAAFSLDTLIRKFTILVLNAAGHFAILTFANEYNIFFLFPFLSFLFLSFIVTGGTKEEIKTRKDMTQVSYQ